MNNTLKIPTMSKPTTTIDRPGWIPSEINHDWDTNPYAYQTEEELMPAGGLHGQLLAGIVELLRYALKVQGLMLLPDTFLLYRDEQGIKQRIAPDLLLMPFRFPPPSAYDLDVEPAPLCVVEVTSPRSHRADLEDKVSFYMGLGIPTYLVIDAITPRSQLRRQIALRVWRLVDGQPRKIRPDAQSSLALPEMGLRVLAQGQRLSFVDAVSGEALLDTEQLATVLQAEHQARLEAETRARTEVERAEIEAEARRIAEAEIARLQALLAKKDSS